MAHKKRHGSAPVPVKNQSKIGPPGEADPSQQTEVGGGAPFQEQDPKRRLGNFESAGEHARQQPGPVNDG